MQPDDRCPAPPGPNSTIAERLRWARARAGFTSPRDAAIKLNWPLQTCRKHESGERGANGLKLPQITQYASGYGVSETWLATGIGSPYGAELELTEDEIAVVRALRMAKTDEAVIDRWTNHLGAWRRSRSLTQEQLAEKVGTTKAVISNLETGARNLSARWLHLLAPALGTTPGFLLDYDPGDIDMAYLNAALAVPQKHRKQALQILETFNQGWRENRT